MNPRVFPERFNKMLKMNTFTIILRRNRKTGTPMNFYPILPESYQLLFRAIRKNNFIPTLTIIFALVN